VDHFAHLDPDPDLDPWTPLYPDPNRIRIRIHNTAGTGNGPKKMCTVMRNLTCFGRLLPDIMLEREPRIPCPPYTRAAGRLLIVIHNKTYGTRLSNITVKIKLKLPNLNTRFRSIRISVLFIRFTESSFSKNIDFHTLNENGLKHQPFKLDKYRKNSHPVGFQQRFCPTVKKVPYGIIPKKK
jgi:hypothetical protein